MKIKSPKFHIIINHPRTTMNLQLPGNLKLPGNSLELPSGTTLESLYQLSNQSIWFLAWILKKVIFWTDLAKGVLEEPFTVKRDYWPNGKILMITNMKNDKQHGIYRSWFDSGQKSWENHWKDDIQDGVQLCFGQDGLIWWKSNWKNGQVIAGGGKR